MQQTTNVSEETRALGNYVESMRSVGLPSQVRDKARQHILDTLASIVSGSNLLAGQKAAEFIRLYGEGRDSMVVGTKMLSSAVNAAMANGMSAHADETDDSHAPSLSHPGCAVVPAALAAAERKGASGEALIRAVVAGYDVGCRGSHALGREHMDLRTSTHSSHALVGVFGATAAASVIEELDEQQARHALSYAAQMASGVTSWLRDGRHVEKAYVFGGMPARNGVSAALMVAAGLDGVEDVFSGHPNFLDAWSPEPQRQELASGLGERFEISRTNIKKYCVGSPAQAAVQAMEQILDECSLQPSDVENIEIRLPSDLARVVDSRSMPDINVQYLLAGTLIDGRFSFAMAHDDERMKNNETVQQLVQVMELEPDDDIAMTRQAKLFLRTKQGNDYRQHVRSVRGTAEDPMTAEEVEEKAAEITEPVLGVERSQELIRAVRLIDQVEDVKELRHLLEA